MSNNTTISTHHPLTFRYNCPEKGSKTSKLSIDIGVYELLKENEKTLELEKDCTPTTRKRAPTITDKWLYDQAGKLKEQNPDVPFASYVREYLYTKLIDSDFLDGYKIDTNYKKIMCRKDDTSNTTIRIPAALYFALTKMFGDENVANSVINQAYVALRSREDTEETNSSFVLRHKLLEQVLDPSLTRINAEALLIK